MRLLLGLAIKQVLSRSTFASTKEIYYKGIKVDLKKLIAKENYLKRLWLVSTLKAIRFH